MKYAIRIKQSFLFFLAVSVFLDPSLVEAASLSLSPQTRSLHAGDRITVSVYANAGGTPVNAVSGTVSYDPSSLEAVSVGKTSSIVTLWVQEPSITSGNVSFEGVIPNPGFSGSLGKIVDVVFRAKKEGSTALLITNASVLANDGLGTEVLTGTSGSTFSIATTDQTAPVEIQEDAAPSSRKEPVLLSITSSTHPDPLAWHNKNTGTFGFVLPQGTEAIRLILSRFATAKPSVVYRPALSEKTLDAIPEGTTYLLMEALVNGSWSEPASYQIKVDTIAPELSQIQERTRTDATDPVVELLVSAKDAGSGMSKFFVSVDGGAEQGRTLGEPLRVGPLSPGAHTITVFAADRAGNRAAATYTANIEALPAPQLRGSDREVLWGENLQVSGIASHFFGTVRLDLHSGGGVFSASGSIEPDGTFVLSRAHDLPPGRYEARVVTVDARGASSVPSEAFYVDFKSRPIGDLLLSFGKDLGAGFFVILAILGFAAVLSGAYLRFVRWRKHLLKEIRDVDLTVEKSFALLRDDVEAFVEEITKESSKRKLTAVEKRFVKTMKTNLSEAKEILKREVSDIKKQTH